MSRPGRFKLAVIISKPLAKRVKENCERPAAAALVDNVGRQIFTLQVQPPEQCPPHLQRLKAVDTGGKEVGILRRQRPARRLLENASYQAPQLVQARAVEW